MDQAQKLRKIAEINAYGRKNRALDMVSEPALTENNAQSTRTSRVIAIASGKGGVGKTSIAVNLAIMLSRFGKKVTVLDADLGLANINVILGYIPKYTLQHVFKGQKKLSEIIVEVPQGFRIIAGASGFYQLANIDAHHRERFINSLEEIDTGDIMIIDTSAGVSENVLGFVLSSDEVIVVTTPEPTAITDAYGIIKAIAAQTSDITIRLLVNRAQSNYEAKKVANRIINIASQFLNTRVGDIGFVYEDAVVPSAVRSQKPFLITHPKSRPARCIRHLAAALLEMDMETMDTQTGFFRKLMKRMGMHED